MNQASDTLQTSAISRLMPVGTAIVASALDPGALSKISVLSAAAVI